MMQRDALCFETAWIMHQALPGTADGLDLGAHCIRSKAHGRQAPQTNHNNVDALSSMVLVVCTTSLTIYSITPPLTFSPCAASSRLQYESDVPTLYRLQVTRI